MLDRLPVWAQHLAIAFVATFGLFFASAVVENHGLFPFPWYEVLCGALNAGAVAGATVGTLYLTTLTRRYGIGKKGQ